MNEFVTVLGAVVPVFGIMVAGLMLRRLGWLTEAADQSLLRVSINLLMPALIFDSVLGNAALRRPENLVLPPLVGSVMVMVGISVAWLAARLLGIGTEREQRTFALTTGLQNYVYISLPLTVLLFDSGTTGVLLVHNVGVEMILWTVGVAVLSGGRLGSNWRKIINPPLVALVLGVVLNFAGLRFSVPGMVLMGGRMILTAVHLLGQCAIPVALLLTGAIIADHFNEIHGGRAIRVVVSAVLLRLGLMPVLFLLVARFLPCSIELKRVIVIEGAVSSAMFPIVMAKHYGGDTRTAIQVVMGTTFAGLVMIPLWIRLGGQVVGLW